MPRALPLTVRLHQPACAGVRSRNTDPDAGNAAAAGCRQHQVGRDGGHRARQCGAPSKDAAQQHPSRGPQPLAEHECVRAPPRRPAVHCRRLRNSAHAQRACIASPSAARPLRARVDNAPGVALRQQLVEVVQVHKIVELPGGQYMHQCHGSATPPRALWSQLNPWHHCAQRFHHGA